MTDTAPLEPDVPIYVLGVKASDFMLIEAFDAKVNASGLTIMSGPNANGKTGALTAIEATLRGGASVPEMPVRAGAERGETQVVLGPDGVPLYTVRRVYRDGGNSTLEVKAADGSKVKSPQALLDAMTDAATFDPLEFADPKGVRTEAAKNDRRLEMLLALAPLRIDIRAHDAESLKLFNERAVVAKRVKELEAVVKDAAASAAVAGAEEDETALVTEIARLENAGTLRAAAAKRRDELAKEIEDVEDRAKKLRAEATALDEKAKKLADEWVTQGAKATPTNDPDPAVLRTNLDAIRTRNAARRGATADRAKAEERAKQLLAETTRHAELDAKLKARDQERTDAIAAARFPVKALTIDSQGRLAINDKGNVVPFSQASTAQRIKVAFAVTASRRPKLRTCLIRDGNALDHESIAQVAKIAAHYGFSVLMERIAPDSGAACIEFRDGKVVGQIPATTGGAS